jgi:Rod binding domain-containing protein
MADPVKFSERLNQLSPVEQRHVVAQQFEAILLRQLLEPALKTMPGAGNGIYSYLLTDAFAQKLSAGRGLGLAAILERQFTPPGELKSTAPASPLSTAGPTSAVPLP